MDLETSGTFESFLPWSEDELDVIHEAVHRAGTGRFNLKTKRFLVGKLPERTLVEISRALADMRDMGFVSQPRPKMHPRTCMSCLKKFESEGPQNRMCYRCKNDKSDYLL